MRNDERKFSSVIVKADRQAAHKRRSPQRRRRRLTTVADNTRSLRSLPLDASLPTCFHNPEKKKQKVEI